MPMLHLATWNGDEKIVHALLNIFRKEEKDELIEFVMQQDKKKLTALHIATKKKT